MAETHAISVLSIASDPGPSTPTSSTSSPSSSLSPDAAQIRDAGPPFDDADADIIVRSSDGVDFRLYKSILIKASHAFRDMFAAQPLPASSPSPSPDPDHPPTTRDGLPMIPLPEPAHALTLLFTLLYPIPNADVSTPSDVRALLHMLDKYCVEPHAPTTAAQILLAFAPKGPELAYVLACRYRLPDVARAAAKLTLRKPAGLSALSDADAANISGLQYHRLVQYQNACIGAALHAIKTFLWSGVDRPVPPAPSPLAPATMIMTAPQAHAPDACACRRLGFVLESGKVTSTMPFWLMDLRTRCLNAVQKAPAGASVLEPEMLFQTLGAYAQQAVCAECVRRIAGPLYSFCRSLAGEIDRRIAEVPLVVE